jgi:nicotinamide-nucleotide amidase
MLLRQNGHVFIFMPGVPKEMQAIMDDYGWQKLQSLFPAKPLQVINLRTIGVYESRLSEKITDLITQFSDVSIAFLPSYTGVTIRLSALPDKQTKLQDLAEAIRHRLGHLVFAEGEESIANVVGRLLLHHHQTIAIAESCSGGLVSHWLTENPGSSAYIHYNQVTYSNRAKQRFLGVSGELLEKHGAVSDAVAEAMARGARERAESDYSLAITGIAGPDGGTQDKPVGLVYIALCHPDDTVQVKQYNFHYDRSTNKVMTAAAALNLLRLALLGAPDFAA